MDETVMTGWGGQGRQDRADVRLKAVDFMVINYNQHLIFQGPLVKENNGISPGYIKEKKSSFGWLS